MRLGKAGSTIVRWDDQAEAWTTNLTGAPSDVLALLERPLGAGGIGQPSGRADGEVHTAHTTDPIDATPSATTTADLAPRGLPFAPTSLRGVMMNELHFVRGARTMVRHFMPGAVSRFIGGYEAITRRTFPALKPAPRFYEVPAFYFGSHTTVVADGTPVSYPAACRFRDFELELGAIVTRAWDPASQGAPRAADVIGAFTVINDFSARDLQFADERRSPFSGVVKAKAFATGMGATVVTADEVLPRWDAITGRVRVNGDVWCEGSTAGGLYDLDTVIAHIAADERLVPGEVISLGTLPGCCGLELDRFVQPGDTITLELDGIGTLTNEVAR